MLKEIIVTNLTNQKGEILATIQELKSCADEEKILVLKLKFTSGSVPEALEIINPIHTSDVDLITESSGNIEAGGLLLAAAGKTKTRKARFDTIFMLRSISVGDGTSKKKTIDPYASCIIQTLVSLGARKSGLIEIMKNQTFITSIDARRLKIIDDDGIVMNKYKEGSKKASEKAVVVPQAT